MKKFMEKWKKFAIIFANFQIKLFLHIIYFILLLPYKLGFALKKLFTPQLAEKSSSWIDLQEKKDTIDGLRRQF